ncbi:sortase (plasmid) [Rubrobacter tropicus]|uniref:Sortase n=2 Tax=Rubrobacter tropicus TaxID=2653851 RepID=A0A6G8QG91_9ACTN|nr:sortase [Rubrobacter tropicus]
MVLAGVALIASFFLAGRLDSTATNSEDPGGFNVPRLETTTGGGEETSQAGPQDTTLKLTVPSMSRIEDDEIPSTDGGDEASLKKYAAIHLEGTGFPWQEEANVYIAGHRLGYPNTESWLTFWDMNKVGVGDEIFVTDSDGTEYTYKVFKELTVGPSDTSVTSTEPGKNILTLQTCTLPDYSKRLIVQAELVQTVDARGGPSGRERTEADRGRSPQRTPRAEEGRAVAWQLPESA